MKLKQIKKEYLIIVITIILLILFHKNIIRFGYESQVNQTCLEEKQKLFEEFNVGEILIRFENFVSEEKAKEILESYGLTQESFNNHLSKVIVPKGTEAKWTCILLEKESENVVRIYPKYELVYHD